ncbi:MAG: DNA/RNA nuclease SfsA [Oscillospiraceae bacterium]|nr:DNA/RNA nuclease SfsA [Oscillospiraceae bacterium]
MRYSSIAKGRFLARPNRFIAHVDLEGRTEVCHVKNTGRCRELLTPGAAVYLERSGNPARKTKYDLIAVEKGDLLINMDAQAPNKVFGEWAAAGKFLPGLTLIRPEFTWEDSRFDFMLEDAQGRVFVEVKGVTLEEDGEVRFPDAPTERGVKHLRGLQRAAAQEYRAAVFFVVQMKGVTRFRPNDKTHPAFGAALREAAGNGVGVYAYDCAVTPDSLELDAPVPVDLTPWGER